MEKINIAEILKNCPKGMELDCTMFDNVTLLEVEEGAQFPITIKVGIDDTYLLTEYGEWNDGDINAKCVIFPKGKDTWEGFISPCKFKEGDVVFYDSTISIFKVWRDETLFRTYCILYTKINNPIYRFEINKPLLGKDICKKARLATEKEKEKLFNAIKENGYRWNPEAKTLDKLIVPKFKVGDRIKTKTSSYNYFVAEIRDNSYLAIYNHDEYPYLIPFADEKCYELVPNKFDLSALKPYKSEILYRNSPGGYWKPAFWGAYMPQNSEQHSNHNFLTTDGFVRYCIPFEGNEHLMGKQDDCSEYYKTWED